jgi:hypothetical protein
MLLSHSPRLLAKAVDTMLEIIYDTFSSFHLDINWNKGKSEGVVALRGKHAVEVRESWRQEDGSLGIVIPCAGRTLRITDVYKHLGTYISASGETRKNVAHRVQSAMAAYSPIACKVFGSELLLDVYKLAFMRSLVLSRLTFNLHICVLTQADVKKLAAVYMRVLRRIAGDVRFSADTKMTDLQVREQLKAPSFDCLLMVARLRYMGRIVRLQPPSLVAILHVHRNSKRLPWIRLIASDCDQLLRLGYVHGIGSLLDDPSSWLELFKSENGWNRIVDKVFFIESCLDRCAPPECPEACASRALTWSCDSCGDRFATSRALESHQRAKHGARLAIKQFVGSATCPSCSTDFRTRLRCIAHLSDRRRPKCTQWVLSNCTPFSPKELLRLDEVDRAARRQAQQQGRSHAIASLPAKTVEGKIVGRIS